MLKKSIQDGWNLYCSSFAWVFPSLVAVSLLDIAIECIPTDIEWNWKTLFLILVALSVYSITTSISLILIDESNHHKHTSYSDVLWRCLKLFPYILFADLAYGLYVCIGFFLFIIPGVYWGTTKSFYRMFILLDDNKFYSDSFKSSKKLIKTHFSPVALVVFSSMIISVVPPYFLSQNQIAYFSFITLESMFIWPLSTCIHYQQYQFLKSK